MSRNRAILLTILGIVAAYFIIRGINAWADKHEKNADAAFPAYRTEQSCAASSAPSPLFRT